MKTKTNLKRSVERYKEVKKAIQEELNKLKLEKEKEEKK